MKQESAIIGKRVFRASGPRDEWEHFIRCKCGQRLDMRKLDQVFAHEENCPLRD